MKPRCPLPCILVAVTLVGAASLAFAQAPAWWANRNVIATNAQPNDFAAVNQGQVKWLATQAAAELSNCLQHVGGAGSNVAALVSRFSPTNNYLPVNLGQVKNTAKSFYDRLYELDLINCYPAGAGVPYPWSDSPNPPNDYAMANIGQAKYAFSFDTAADSDADSIPDIWECDIGSDPYVNDAYDLSTNLWAHGLTNFQIYQNPSVLNGDNYSTLNDGIPDWWKVQYDAPVTTPANATAPNGLTWLQNYQNDIDPIQNTDVDGDGLSNAWEIQYGLDPWVPNDSSADPDGDGLTNLQEDQKGTNPNNADTDGDGIDDNLDSKPTI